MRVLTLCKQRHLASLTRFSAIGRDGNSIASAVPQAQNCQVDLTHALERYMLTVLFLRMRRGNMPVSSFYLVVAMEMLFLLAKKVVTRSFVIKFQDDS